MNGVQGWVCCQATHLPFASVDKSPSERVIKPRLGGIIDFLFVEGCRESCAAFVLSVTPLQAP